MAHDDQDRQGRQAQQARQRTVRRDPSCRRRGARHRRRTARRTDVAPRPRGAARRGHRPGTAGQLLCAVSLERRTRRVPHNQRADQRRRRPRLAATRVQGVRREPAPGEVGGPRRRRTRPRSAARSDRRRKDLSRSLFQRTRRRCKRCARAARVGARSHGCPAVDRRSAGRPVFAHHGGTRRAPGQGRAAGVVGVADRKRRRVRGAGGRPARRLPAGQHGRHGAGESWQAPATCW